MTLEEFFTASPECAVALSGGVDSVWLLHCAARYAEKTAAYYVSTAFQPAFELAHARRAAEEAGVPLRVLEMDILSVPEAAANGPDRCYYCKRALFRAVAAAAAADGFTVLLDGSNASDDAGDRPGMRALRELRVRSPLRECGWTKTMIRSAAREAGLFVWNKPAYACLATRIPTGQPIAAADLARTERAEATLAAMGFSDFRVRLRGGGALVQVTAAQMPLALERRQEILRALSGDYACAALDLKAREETV